MNPMTLGNLIGQRLSQDERLIEMLATFGDEPAIFYNSTPDDKATAWKDLPQYPRIVYSNEMRNNPERKTSGTLSVNIWCLEDGILPEKIEPIVKELLCGIFLCPDNSPPYSLSWVNSDPLSVDSETGIVYCMAMTFDIYAFPNQITADPDPILAINKYVKDAMENEITVIGGDELKRIFKPSEALPAFYFRLEAMQTEEVYYTVAWVSATIAGHIFADGLEAKWLRGFIDRLATDAEIIMLDKSPMFITNISCDSSFDALSVGQLRIKVRFGILRKKPQPHTLQNAYINDLHIGGD